MCCRGRARRRGGADAAGDGGGSVAACACALLPPLRRYCLLHVCCACVRSRCLLAVTTPLLTFFGVLPGQCRLYDQRQQWLPWSPRAAAGSRVTTHCIVCACAYAHGRATASPSHHAPGRLCPQVQSPPHPSAASNTAFKYFADAILHVLVWPCTAASAAAAGNGGSASRQAGEAARRGFSVLVAAARSDRRCSWAGGGRRRGSSSCSGARLRACTRLVCARVLERARVGLRGGLRALYVRLRECVRAWLRTL